MAAKLNCRQNAADIASVKSLPRSAKETEDQHKKGNKSSELSIKINCNFIANECGSCIQSKTQCKKENPEKRSSLA